MTDNQRDQRERKLPISPRKLRQAELKEHLAAQGIIYSKNGAFKPMKTEVNASMAKAMELGQIFKFQAPLFTTEAQPTVLVYNRDKSWLSHIPLDENLSRLFREKGSPKFYIMAIPRKDGQLLLQHFVEDQDW